MKTVVPPISFAGSQLGEVRHVCAFFNSDDEEYRVLLPFIKDGFECGDKAVHVVNPDQHRDHLQRLTAAGIDPTAAQQSGQFELRPTPKHTFGTAVLIRIGCWRYSSSWPAATPREHFPSAALSADGLGGRRSIAHRQSH